ncbi:MAG: galactose-1-phosphate uridylyltransferase [Thaumarchaeota archaeon]|nr:galactose-1-phosphate uridylyltransferase [Nitrososphaerota archaeon]MCL5318950.1 galactose-1-phosphate uridylyltransferase [Nitrososphaerota archaeon]
MSEFRQEITTGEWTIIAAGRARRPTDFKSTDSSTLPSFEKTCPFCPGQEYMTPPDVLRYPEEGGGAGWSMRGFVNKFPILSPEPPFEPTIIDGHFLKRGGAGVHEVLVETPRHNGFVPSRSVEEILLMLKAYRQRYLARREKWLGGVMIIFKNEGASAGASIIHPHSQLLVTSLIPPMIEAKLRIAKQYFEDSSRCLYREIEQWENESKSRLVLRTEQFTVFNPYASRTPFETCIVPRSDTASFADMSQNEMEELARVLLDVMGRFYRIFRTPDFNWIIYTTPYGEENRKDFIWHLQIQPRLTVLGGFEMAGGMFVNVVRPEDAAAVLREAESTA